MKLRKYQDVKIEIEKLWEKQANVVPVAIGSLPGAISRDLRKHDRSREYITKPATEDSPTGNNT